MASQPLTWDDFQAEFSWKQGEHVTLVGVTGAGKTTLAKELIDRRRYVAVIANKPRDPMVDEFRDEGFRVVKSWPPDGASSRVVLWPKIDTVEDVPKQREVIGRALMDIYRAGGWCVYLDETNYVTDFLKLAKPVELLWRQGRALGVSVVAGTQRPANIPLLAYSQATHLFFFRSNDERDIKRVAGMAGVHRESVAEAVTGLPWHDFLWVDTHSGAMARSRVDRSESAG